MRAAPSPVQTSFSRAKQCSRQVDRLLGLARGPHLPIAGTLRLGKEPAAASGWELPARVWQERSPHPTETITPLPQTGPLHSRAWTSSWSDQAEAAKSVCCHGEPAKAFCCFLPQVHLLFLSSTGQKCQASSDLSKETQEKPH